MNRKYNKIIIWGAKFDSGHTHAFVHEPLMRAAQHLGYPAYWLDNRDLPHLPIEFFDHALIISEQWLVFANGLSNQLPLRPTSAYLIHYLGNKGPVEGNPGASMYLGKVGKLLDFRFACNWGVNGVEDKNYAYHFDKSVCTPINEGTSFLQPQGDLTLFYSMWATDLMPEEIRVEDRYRIPVKPYHAFFGGTIREDNQEMFDPFIRACIDHQMPFYYNTPWQNPLPVAEIRLAVTNAYLALDVRPRNHLANKYISCRIMKNISYGQLGLTNCPATYEFFEGDVAFHSDPYALFDVACEMKHDPQTLDKILRQMTIIKEKHTYVNRLRDMITAAELA